MKNINTYLPEIEKEIEGHQMITHEHLAVQRKKRLTHFDMKLEKLM